MVKYANRFHKEGKPEYGPEFYETDAKPIEYRGYLIFQRIKGHVWDIVKDGECVSQYAGPNGAKNFIDTISNAVEVLALSIEEGVAFHAKEMRNEIGRSFREEFKKDMSAKEMCF